MAVTTEWTVPQTNRTVYSGASGDTKPSNPVAGSIFYENDTGVAYEFDGSSWVQNWTNGAAHVVSPSEAPDGTVSRGADDAITATPTAAFTGQTAETVSVRLIGDGAAVNADLLVYIVFNTTDAATDLASDAARDRITASDTWQTYLFSSSTPCTRMDYKHNGGTATNAVLEWRYK